MFESLIVLASSVLFYFIGRYSISRDELKDTRDGVMNHLHKLSKSLVRNGNTPTNKSDEVVHTGKIIRPDAHELEKRRTDQSLLKEFDRLDIK